MWDCCWPPARPFRTFQNKAWVSSNCALQQPGSRPTVETVAAVLQQLPRTHLHPPWIWRPTFSGLEDRCASVRLEMSIKRRLLSMLLCCVYCVASLFCLHPNRHNCFSGARWVEGMFIRTLLSGGECCSHSSYDWNYWVSVKPKPGPNC